MLRNDFPAALLFYAPGDSYDAIVAKGTASPNFNERTELIPDGPFGGAIRCEDKERLSWKAPGNIYGERGTLAFNWRARYQAGPTPFPIFRVAFADHSSWDCVFLRIDWNGEGFEAMVTDINLSRARVWTKLEGELDPDKWFHFALAWDEKWGIKFYVDGKLAAEEYRPAVYFTGLDQFGPHSRIISHWQVQSDYNFIRGGDVAEIAIFDQMIPEEAVSCLARGEFCEVPAYTLDPDCPKTREEWTLRNGFDQKLAPIEDNTTVHKVEIPNAYDHKRWWWKACDGIRETTWPGVFNRSRLKGRKDYFQLPDWDCYSVSGKAITFEIPENEIYNHIEISGSAHGVAEIVEEAGKQPEKLFDRGPGRERSTHDVPVRRGGKIRFTNEEQEEPIGDFSVYHVYEGVAPQGVKSVSYRVKPGVNEACDRAKYLSAFIEGRYTPYERNRMTAVLEGKDLNLTVLDTAPSFPFANILVPYTVDDTLGLDGIEVSFDVVETDKFAIQIKDPLWYYRNLAHFVFKAEKGHKTLWFDTRDRILPEGKMMYLTIAGEKKLPENIQIRAVYKSAADAKAQHVEDRFRQLRDAYGHMTEERPLQKEYNLFNRYYGDMMDLLKVEPNHIPGIYYRHDMEIHMLNRMKKPIEHRAFFQTEKVPEGTPAWAFKQIEFLKRYKRLINWYIDNRQIEDGEFGGGLSDDGDFVATWFTFVNMDSDADKIKEAIFRNTDAFYDQGMFTNGLCSIQADELHSSEEGLISLSSCLNAEFGNPKWLEKAMETGRSVDFITGINKAGHRHFKSSFYNGSWMATEMPWGIQQAHSFTAIGPAWQVARYNGNPILVKELRELADSQMAHFHAETGRTCPFIRFEDDEEVEESTRSGGERSMMIPAWKIFKEEKYYDTLPESKNKLQAWNKLADNGNEQGIDFRPLKEGTDILDKDQIAQHYEGMNQLVGMREYYNTLGSPWIDRVFVNAETLTSERLGDPTCRVARYNFPTQTIHWKFNCTGDDEKVAILSPITKDDHLKVIVCNISNDTVFAKMIGCSVDPGTWSVTTGQDTNDDDQADQNVKTFEQEFEWSQYVKLAFPPKSTTVIEMKLVKAGVPYWDRCDLGISKEDIHLYKHGLNVTIHSLGAQDSPSCKVVLKNSDGEVLKTQVLPPLPAPTDLWPRYRDVTFYLYHVEDLKDCYVEIDPDHELCETTRENNIVYLKDVLK